MNYGEEFVRLYNEKFKEISSDVIVKLESYYNTNYTYIKAKRLITESLMKEFKLLNSRNELFEKSHDTLKWNIENYSSDVTISIVNDELKELFDNKTEVNNDLNYSEFISLFVKWEAIRRFFLFLNENNDVLENKFALKKITQFLIVLKDKRELYRFKNLDKKNEVKKESVYGLTQNEKMILLHVLLHEFKDSGLNSLSTEYFRVLSLTSECLIEKDVLNANTNFTKYNYFYKGVNASDRPSFEKIKMIDSILNKIESLTTIEKFKKVLIRYKNSK